MTAKDLKNAILQEAVQGKLVPQIVSEGNAKDLLEQIKAEKAKLVKEGKIKKEKPLPEITEDEIPFDIPESWCWCRLGEITTILGDGIHGTPEYDVTGEYYFVNGNNLSNGKIIIKSDTKKVNQTEFEKYKKPLNENTVFVSINGTLGNLAFYSNEKIILGKSACYFNLVFKEMKYYIYYLLKTKYFIDYAEAEATKTTIRNVSLGAMRNLLIPLPPLAEQKRIVAAIEKFMPLVEEYGKKETVLNELNAQIGTLTKKAILQEAVQGKLVPQIVSEGNAKDLLEQIKAEKAKLVKEGKIKKEKPLPGITEDEIPFDIPENWCWCRLGELGDFTRGSGIKRDETTKEGFPCVRYGEMYTTYKVRFLQTKSFTSKEVFNKCHKIHSNDILMALTGENKWDIALAAVYEGNDELAMGGDLCKFTPIKCDSSFLVYLINSPYGIEYKRNTSTGDIIVHTSTSKLGNLLIPLPPLSEQKRIVAAIEKLLPYCEKLGRE